MTQRRSSIIQLSRQDALNEEELDSLLISQDDINVKIVNNILCFSNEAVQLKIPLINKLMTIFGIIIGILFFTRGLIDGGLSMIGLWLRLIYFTILSISYGVDDRLKADRWSFLTPSLSGLLLTIAQLTGMFIIDGPFECSSFSTCL